MIGMRTFLGSQTSYIETSLKTQHKIHVSNRTCGLTNFMVWIANVASVSEILANFIANFVFFVVLREAMAIQIASAGALHFWLELKTVFVEIQSKMIFADTN